MLVSVLVFSVSLLVSFLLTPLARRAALHSGFLDQPEARKVHFHPMPLLGGLAIYTAVLLAIVIFVSYIGSGSPESWSQIMGILGGATLLVFVGVLDDRGYLHSHVKLLIGMPLAALLLFWGGIAATAWPVAAFENHPQVFFVMSLLFTLIWVIAVTASFSILDYMDGLCSGVAAVASGFFWILALWHGQILVASLAAALMGGALGFLRWNFNPAKIFMGDSGALFIGFMMATLALKLEFPELPDTQSWIVPTMILGIPFFDGALVTISRIRRGVNPLSSPGRDHTCHRLDRLGLGQRRAVLVFYAFGLFFGSLALLVTTLSPWESYILFVAVVVFEIGSILTLERVPCQRQEKPSLLVQ